LHTAQPNPDAQLVITETGSGCSLLTKTAICAESELQPELLKSPVAGPKMGTRHSMLACPANQFLVVVK
jgi:hypothetical protein